jgi:hypothetical protein
MKKQGQLVTLPSIPTASDAFAPPKLRPPSTYSPTEPVMFVTACPGDHLPHCWLPLPKNNVILSALQLSFQLQHQTISWPKYCHVDITKIWTLNHCSNQSYMFRFCWFDHESTWLNTESLFQWELCCTSTFFTTSRIRIEQNASLQGSITQPTASLQLCLCVLCLKMKAQGWSIKNMLRSNSILNTQQQTRCQKDKVRNHKIPERVCKEGFSPSISNIILIFLSLMSWKGDWDTEKRKQLP